MVIDHIGIVVKSIEQGIRHWEEIFNYRQMTKVIINTRQKVRVVFLSKDDSLPIKLVEPLDQTSPVFAVAQKGGGLHHICFKCENITQEIEKFKEKKIRVIAAPQPGEAFENESIAFLYAQQGINIELIDTDKKAGLIE